MVPMEFAEGVRGVGKQPAGTFQAGYGKKA